MNNVRLDFRRFSTAPSGGFRYVGKMKNQNAVSEKFPTIGNKGNGKGGSNPNKKPKKFDPTQNSRSTPASASVFGASKSASSSSSSSSKIPLAKGTNNNLDDLNASFSEFVSVTDAEGRSEEEIFGAGTGADGDENNTQGSEEEMYHMRTLRKVVLKPHAYNAEEISQAVSVLAQKKELPTPWAWVSAFRALQVHGLARDILTHLRFLLVLAREERDFVKRNGNKTKSLEGEGDGVDGNDREGRRRRRRRNKSSSIAEGTDADSNGASTSSDSLASHPDFIASLNAGLNAIAEILLVDSSVQHLKRATLRHAVNSALSSPVSPNMNDINNPTQPIRKKFEKFSDRGLGSERPLQNTLSLEEQLEVRREFFETLWELPTANTLTFNIALKLIKNSTKIDRFGLAVRVYGEMLVRSKGNGASMQPDDFTYNTLLACCCDRSESQGTGTGDNDDINENANGGNGAASEHSLFPSKTSSLVRQRQLANVLNPSSLDPEELFKKIDNPTHISYLGVIQALRFDWRRALTYYAQSFERNGFSTQAATCALTSLKIARQPLRAMFLHLDLREGLMGGSGEDVGMGGGGDFTGGNVSMKLQFLDKKYYLKLIETLGVPGLDRRLTWYKEEAERFGFTSSSSEPDLHISNFVENDIERRKLINMKSFIDHLNREEVQEKLQIRNDWDHDPRYAIANIQTQLIANVIDELPSRIRNRPEVVMLCIHVLGRNLKNVDLAERIYEDFFSHRAIHRDAGERGWDKKIEEVMGDVRARGVNLKKAEEKVHQNHKVNGRG